MVESDGVSYFEETITTVYPNRSHEVIEQTISILINAYCRKYHKLYFPMGSSKIGRYSLNNNEPDVSYAFDTAKSSPDLSVEVVFSSGGTANIKPYYYYASSEVWLWQNEQIKFYQFVSIDDRYTDTETEFSYCLKNLSSEFLIEFINRGLTESPLTIEADFIARLDSN